MSADRITGGILQADTRTATHGRLRQATLAFVALQLLCSAPAYAQSTNPVVPNATLGPFRHGTFPSLESKGRQWTHVGVDLIAPEGSPVYAVADGGVVSVINNTSAHFSWAGNAVMLQHKHPDEPDKNIYSIYLHLREAPSSSLGKVEGGRSGIVEGGKTKIGEVGRTGAANDVPHVHFEIRKFGTWLWSWGGGIDNIYGPGDQRSSRDFREQWIDPLIFFQRFPTGMPVDAKAATARRHDFSRNVISPADVVDRWIAAHRAARAAHLAEVDFDTAQSIWRAQERSPKRDWPQLRESAVRKLEETLRGWLERLRTDLKGEYCDYAERVKDNLAWTIWLREDWDRRLPLVHVMILDSQVAYEIIEARAIERPGQKQLHKVFVEFSPPMTAGIRCYGRSVRKALLVFHVTNGFQPTVILGKYGSSSTALMMPAERRLDLRVE